MEDLIDFSDYKRNPRSVPLNNDCSKRAMETYDYQLDNFYRNAMLLFCNHGSYVENLTRTFQKYRFVIDKYVNLTSLEIEEKCASFFSRHFFEYGAVAVVIIEPEMDYSDGAGMLRARDRSYHETVILKYLTTDVPASLRGKPKIYITENTSVSDRIAIDNYEDILALHLPFETNYRDNFISKLCKNMEKFGENRDFLEIVKNSIQVDDVTIRKIESIYEFVGQEHATQLEPFFSDMLPNNNDSKKRRSITVDAQEKPWLTCTFKKQFILPVDIYFRLGTHSQPATEMGNLVNEYANFMFP